VYECGGEDGEVVARFGEEGHGWTTASFAAYFGVVDED
jgi:hypothetical protein